MSEASWARDLLQRMHYPVNANNMTTVLAWEYAEGGHFHNSAHFNPLNTTMAHGKYGSINSAGVASYPDYETGMHQTIATLKLDAYSKVRADLGRGATPGTTAAAISASPWGTWHGVAAGPALARARAEVKHHPGIAKGDHHGKHGGKHDRITGKHGPKHDGKHGRKIVLDLQELESLSHVYRRASDEIVRHRRRVGDIAAALEPARAALPNTALASYLKSHFDYLLNSGAGLDQDARVHDELSALTGKIHRLASEADADHDGRWSRREAMDFAAKHKGEHGPALEAVLAGIAANGIVRKSPKSADGPHAKSGHGKNEHGKNGHGKNQHGEHAGSGRKQKIDKMLALAGKQHASEHNSDNHTKYGAWFGNNGAPWCADFVSYVFYHSGNKLPAIQAPKGFAYVPYAINYARQRGDLHTTPHRGDIFLLKDGSHTGIVSKVHSDGTFDTVEGNHSDRVDHVRRNSHDGSYYFWTAIK